MDAFRRVWVIIGAYVAACDATAATAVFIVPDAGCEPPGPCAIVFLFVLIDGLIIAPLPVLLLAIYTESRSARSLLIYICFGIVVAMLPFLRAPLIETFGSLLAWKYVSVALAGAAGGLAYWLIAGRRAGDWPATAAAN